MVRTVIVEDDPMVAQINRQYLQQREEFLLEKVFLNGKEALSYLRRNPVDLVLLDVYMPGMNGMELLRSMRAEKISSAVIMITAATEIDVVDEALKLGITDYLVKPYLMARLDEALQKYLTKARIIKDAQNVDQSLVDQLLGDRRIADDQELRKGLNAKTLATIQKHFADSPVQNYTCESISGALGLSKVTVRRYLNYMIETGELESSIDYDTGGRPRILYILKQGS